MKVETFYPQCKYCGNDWYLVDDLKSNFIQDIIGIGLVCTKCAIEHVDTIVTDVDYRPIFLEGMESKLKGETAEGSPLAQLQEA